MPLIGDAFWIGMAMFTSIAGALVWEYDDNDALGAGLAFGGIGAAVPFYVSMFTGKSRTTECKQRHREWGNRGVRSVTRLERSAGDVDVGER